MNKPDLSIIIVNYNTPQLCVNCIQSIKKETEKTCYEIIIVDNGSSKADQLNVQHVHPDIIWIKSGYNSGFSRANNTGVKIAQGQYLLFLNSDTIILNNAIDKAIHGFKHLSESNDVGLLGVKLLNEDLSHQESTYYYNSSFHELFLQNPFYSFFHLKFNKKGAKQKSIKALMGAFLICKKNVFEKIGCFDSDFFMYAEEFELCHRYRSAKLKLVYYDKAEVIHIGKASSNKITYGQRFLSMFLLYLKNKGRLSVLLLFLILNINFISYYIYGLFKGLKWINEALIKHISLYKALKSIYIIFFCFNRKTRKVNFLVQYPIKKKL